MLLERSHVQASTVLAAGQLSLVAALVGGRFVHPSSDLWQGFVAGLCGVLLGLSVVFNLRGLVLLRHRQRSRKEG